MELQIINTQGQNVGALTVNDGIFAREYNQALVHQVVTAFLANKGSDIEATALATNLEAADEISRQMR